MADYEILRQPTSVWEFENPTLQANQLGVCSDLRDGIETDSLLSKLGNGVDNWDTLPAYNPGGYKVYRALLTQTGTDAPVATVLENSLGGTVVWSYVDVGSFLATLTGAFINGKTLITSPSYGCADDGSSPFYMYYGAVTDTIEMKVFDAATGVAVSPNNILIFIEILVYP